MQEQLQPQPKFISFFFNLIFFFQMQIESSINKKNITLYSFLIGIFLRGTFFINCVNNTRDSDAFVLMKTFSSFLSPQHTHVHTHVHTHAHMQEWVNIYVIKATYTHTISPYGSNWRGEGGGAFYSVWTVACSGFIWQHPLGPPSFPHTPDTPFPDPRPLSPGLKIAEIRWKPTWTSENQKKNKKKMRKKKRAAEQNVGGCRLP